MRQQVTFDLTCIEEAPIKQYRGQPRVHINHDTSPLVIEGTIGHGDELVLLCNRNRFVYLVARTDDYDSSIDIKSGILLDPLATGISREDLIRHEVFDAEYISNKDLEEGQHRDERDRILYERLKRKFEK